MKRVSVTLLLVAGLACPGLATPPASLPDGALRAALRPAPGQAQAVPDEASGWAMLAVGLGAIAALQRRRPALFT